MIKVPTVALRPTRRPNERGANSCWITSGGRETMFPTDNPTMMLLTYRATTPSRRCLRPAKQKKPCLSGCYPSTLLILAATSSAVPPALRVKTISSLTARIAPNQTLRPPVSWAPMPVQPQSRRVENARKPRRSHDHCVGSRSHGRPRRPIHRQPGRVQYRPA